LKSIAACWPAVGYWSRELGRFIDITMLFSDEEKLWRQRPVVNYLAYWYLLTHARLTENPPIITFQPATSDRADAMLAQTLDTVYKTVWADAHDGGSDGPHAGWVVAAGTGYLQLSGRRPRGRNRHALALRLVTLPHPETGEDD
jgi:hypothetical protein